MMKYFVLLLCCMAGLVTTQDTSSSMANVMYRNESTPHSYRIYRRSGKPPDKESPKGNASQGQQFGSKRQGSKTQGSPGLMPPPPPRPVQRAVQKPSALPREVTPPRSSSPNLYRPVARGSKREAPQPNHILPSIPYKGITSQAGAIITGPAYVSRTLGSGKLKKEEFIGTGETKRIKSEDKMRPEISGRLLGHLPNRAASQGPGDHSLVVYAGGQSAVVGVAAPKGGSGQITIASSGSIHKIPVKGGETIIRGVRGSKAGDARVVGSVSRPGDAIALPDVYGDDKAAIDRSRLQLKDWPRRSNDS